MLRKLFITVCVLLSSGLSFAQVVLHIKDSITVSLPVPYDSVSSIHRQVFGENYRKEWAAKTRLPVIKISEIRGGLSPTQLGGGHQSHSLRLEEKSGKEWVLRSVQKYSDGLAPELIKGTVYDKWVDDNFSAQHPYSALIVPVLADALKIPHTNPVIGWVAPDQSLGKFAEEFAGKICLLEEREPYGDSDNTPKMLAELDEDNDHRLDSAVFFRARLLDLLIADWGRHEDQWRWNDTKKGDGKNYLVVPRDRDQVLYVNEGILPKTLVSINMLSFLEGFNSSYKDPDAFFINGRKLNQQFLNQYTYEEWMQMTYEFISAIPDTVLRRAVNQLPASSYSLKGDIIFSKLQGRRDNMLNAMDSYYRFLYNTIDIRTSDKNELAEFTGGTDGEIILSIYKLAHSGAREQILYKNTFKPDITQEIRLFVGEGNDEIKINAPASPIKLRIVGGKGEKNYEVKDAYYKVHVYENLDNDRFSDPGKHLIRHRSDDSLNIKKSFSNLYASSGISPLADLRSVDGISAGLSYKIENEGFRKEPYGSMHKLSALHSFSTRSFILSYEAEWKELLKNTDLSIHALADMNGNILNFFGRGNDTYFNQTGDFRTFYRVNYSFYKFEPALKFNLENNISISIGPSFQYFVAGNNEGLNVNSQSYVRVSPSFSIYRSLDKKGNIVIANRTGAGFTSGKAAFYQSAFLGSQDNLLGFRKYRFAGDQVLYNNTELRVSLPDILHYFMPGKIGLIGFFDAGRVWVKNERSDTIHHSLGGGICLAPFNRVFIRAIAGFSKEGMQPSLTLKQRF